MIDSGVQMGISSIRSVAKILRAVRFGANAVPRINMPIDKCRTSIVLFNGAGTTSAVAGFGVKYSLSLMSMISD